MINSLYARMFGHNLARGHGSASMSRKNGTNDIISQNNSFADFGKCSRLIALSVTCLKINILLTYICNTHSSNKTPGYPCLTNIYLIIIMELFAQHWMIFNNKTPKPIRWLTILFSSLSPSYILKSRVTHIHTNESHQQNNITIKVNKKCIS